MVDVGSKNQIWSMWDSLHHLKSELSVFILAITATDLPSFWAATYLSILTLSAEFLEAIILKMTLSTSSFKFSLNDQHIAYLKQYPGKLTWNLKRSPWKTNVLLETMIFRFHVKFRESISNT